MAKYRYTEYFENEVLRKRPYLKKEWCEHILDDPIRVEPQEHNRFRFWGLIEELEGRYLRVITVEENLAPLRSLTSPEGLTGPMALRNPTPARIAPLSPLKGAYPLQTTPTFRNFIS